ncbi:hypothetical protein ABEG17_07145 [Pedococcus sp. KACC 23699]|uniref:Uncharacterized protein n=1 Tax=Pedococcus sp. KACC 23699 TaxID=3149228 RepID=A0AAU7JXP4_9MICO
MRRPTLVLWIFAVGGGLLGACLLVLGIVGAVGGAISVLGAAAVIGLGLIVLAGSLWQLRLLLRHRRARPDFDAARVELQQALDAPEPAWDRPAAVRVGAERAMHEASAPMPSREAPAREVRPWHLAVAWFVAAIIAALGLFFLLGGLVPVLDGSAVLVGAILALLGLAILAGDIVYARGIVQTLWRTR